MKRKKALSPRKKPVQKRSQVTVEAIFEAAAQVFSKNGYAGTTTDRIAERAGVSIGSLYQYFPNKDAVLVGLLERHLEEGQAFLSKLVQTAGEVSPEKTRAIIEIAIAQHSIDPDLHRVLFEEAPRPKSVVRKLKKMEDTMVGAMADMLRNNPTVRPRDPLSAARIIFSTIEMLTHWYVLYGGGELDQDAFVDEMVDMLNRYVFP